MAAGRGMRESVPQKRYADEIFTLKLSSHRKTKAKNDRKLYPVVVREVDKIGKRLKIHFVRFSDPCGSADNIFFNGWNLFLFRPLLLLRTVWKSMENCIEKLKGNCILAERTIHQLVMRYELIRMY